MPDLFDKCHTPKLQEYEVADSMGLIPFFKVMGSEAGPTVVHEGRRVIMLGSNNYLGLTGDERVKRAAVDAVEQYGTGCTGSRLMNGTLPLHHELEEELCDWLGAEAGLVFTTGYSVNLGVISTLVGPRDATFVDVSGHASIIDGARLAPGSFRYFRHNSVSSLRHRLKVWQQEGGEGALVAVDGIYSMEGDVAPVGPIADACREFGARVLVDEAHALGVLGPKGAGVAADAGVEPDLLMGTFSKSLASCGGFILGSKSVVDYVRIACRPFQFTASGVPAALAAALAALRAAREEDWRRVAVRERADQLRIGLRGLGYDVGPDTGTPIVPVTIGEEWEAGRTWRALLDNGVYANCVISPAVPSGRAMLRTSVMATHTEAHIEEALRAFEVARSTSA